MGLNVPFSCSLPFPFPRRLAYIIGSLVTLILLLNFLAPSILPPALSTAPHHEPDASLWSGSKWLPPLLNSDRPDKPAEWDENGHCLFLSPFQALTPAERAHAEQMELKEIAPGIVQINNATSASGKHLNPILALLRDGERKWNNIVNSQSKTFEEAVKRYESKWGRPPPKGFDDWWHFATGHDALLIDEFDAIMESLLPYYGLPIATMKERAEEAEKIPETFTLIVNDGKVELQWNDNYSRDTWWASRGRADKQANLMEPFIAMLPDFRATYTIHDQPSVLIDHSRRTELVDAARKHQVSTHPAEADRFEQNWFKACSPSSALNKGVKDGPQPDSFINNHVAAMSPCDHPSLLETHGMFIEKHTQDSHPKPHTKLYPILVPSKTVLNGDIPITPIGSDGRRDDVGKESAWSSKNGKLYWRGRSTGLDHNKKSGANWRHSHRERLHFLANDRTSDTIDVLSPTGSTGETVINSFPLRGLGQYYMNAKLIAGPWQCNQEDGTCDEMRDEIEFAEEATWEESNNYKYILDIDGNAWSSRFTRLMASFNMVIKSTIFPEWNSNHLPEWFAYVPTKVDYSDLYSILAFFRGTPSGKGSHDEVARRIALNGQCWVERTWRQEDLQIYMFRLYLEYARLVSPDRDNGKMDFVMKDYHRDPPKEVPDKEKGNSLKDTEAMPGIDQ